MLGGEIAGKSRPRAIRHGDRDGKQLACEVGPAVQNRPERRIEQMPVALPEKVRPGAVVRIMAELQRNLPDLEVKLLCQEPRGRGGPLALAPALLIGGGAPGGAQAARR